MQYRITADSFNPTSNDDCLLSADDPIHSLAPVAAMGGLGSRAALQQYNNLNKPVIVGSNKGQLQREQNIKPGTEEWFKLWFGK